MCAVTTVGTFFILYISFNVIIFVYLAGADQNMSAAGLVSSSTSYHCLNMDASKQRIISILCPAPATPNPSLRSSHSAHGKSSFDIWSSILSRKQVNGGDDPGAVLPPPYVHPKAKRLAACSSSSSSALSEKSLEICTECLGSETGSDGFSSYPPSDDEESAEAEEEFCPWRAPNGDESPVNHHFFTSRKLLVFPPPLPSIPNGGDGSNLHLRSHRRNGRLVVEAISVPSRNCFRARRQDGRLLLTLATNELEADETTPPENELEENRDGEEHEGDEGSNGAKQRKEEQRMGSVTNTTKLFGQLKIKTTPWFNVNEAEATKAEEAEEEEDEIQSTVLPPEGPRRVGRLIPTSPSTAAAILLNAFPCYWPTRPRLAAAPKPPTQQPPPPPPPPPKYIVADCSSSNKQMGYSAGKQQQELQVVKAKQAEYVAPLLMRVGCKEQRRRRRRRPLLFWDPHCIAT
ncbi:hypothetical protein Dimus_020055 [Dionaea muscipula]